MRRAIALFALLACVLSRRLDSQQAMAQKVTLPSGVTVARACDRMVSEGVLVASIDARAVPALDSEYFIALAQTISRRVGAPAGNQLRTATYGVLLLHDGSLAQRFPVVRTGQRDLDMRIDGALAISPSDADRAETPYEMPDSLRVLVTFGQHEDGSPFTTSHVSCPAVPYPDNPPREMPAWSLAHPRTISVHGVVSAAGRVDTASVQVDDPSDERYVELAMRSIAQMRFVPAEFDGVKVPTPIDIVMSFGATETADEPSVP